MSRVGDSEPTVPFSEMPAFDRWWQQELSLLHVDLGKISDAIHKRKNLGGWPLRWAEVRIAKSLLGNLEVKQREKESQKLLLGNLDLRDFSESSLRIQFYVSLLVEEILAEWFKNTASQPKLSQIAQDRRYVNRNPETEANLMVTRYVRNEVLNKLCPGPNWYTETDDSAKDEGYE